MSMQRKIQRNVKFERSGLGRESRKARGLPASPHKGHINRKLRSLQLKRSRYARMLVGLLCRATGAYAPPLKLEVKVPTIFQQYAQEAKLTTMCFEAARRGEQVSL